MDYERLMVPAGADFSLDKYDPGETCGYGDKESAVTTLQSDIQELEKLQDVLSAQGKYSVLIIFQGMDTSGKDGAVKHVMSGVNPAAVNVYPFKAPSDEERRHDFFWRCSKVLPERGRFAIFNRSYYEDVVVVRVHPDLLGSRKDEADKEFWQRRYDAINAFERHLTNEGTVVLKFFLHISKHEQAKRLKARIDDPDKQWKCSPSDLKERAFWDDYTHAWQSALQHTSTQCAPWYVIPSNHKYVARVAIAGAIVSKLRSLDLAYPSILPEVALQLKELGTSALADDRGTATLH